MKNVIVQIKLRVALQSPVVRVVVVEWTDDEQAGRVVRGSRIYPQSSFTDHMLHQTRMKETWGKYLRIVLWSIIHAAFPSSILQEVPDPHPTL